MYWSRNCRCSWYAPILSGYHFCGLSCCHWQPAWLQLILRGGGALPWPFIPFIPSLYTMALYTLPLLCFISYSESEPLVTQFVQVSQTWLSPKVYTLVRYMASIKIDGSMQIPFIMCTLFRDNRIQWQQSKKVSSSLTIGLQQLPSSGSIIPKLGLVGVHQPLRVGHRLVHIGKVFKVEISLWGGEDPFETLRSVQFILCL